MTIEERIREARLTELRAQVSTEVRNAEIRTVTAVADHVIGGGTPAGLFGKTMFGSATRYLCGLWIAGMGDDEALMFCAAGFGRWAERRNEHVSPANTELRRFEHLGMICRFSPKAAPTPAQWYCRVPSPMWDVFLMADVVISEVTTPSRRKFYKPSAGRQERMIAELVKIYNATSTVVHPVKPAQAATHTRVRGPNGELRCTRCNGWKHEDEFSVRTDRPHLRKSRCKACMARMARIRYLGVEKMVALNAVGVTFTVSSADDMVGLSCVGCGEPIVAGDTVCGDTRLCHARCVTESEHG